MGSPAPLLCELLLQRAMVRERLRRLPAALEDVDRATALGTSLTELGFCALVLLKSLATFNGQSRSGLGHGSRAQTVGDWIARALARANQSPQKALEDLQQALVLDPNSVGALQNLAYLQTDLLKDEASAVDSLDRLLRIQPDHEAARGGRCVLLARVGKSELAQADILFLEQHFARLQPATLYQIGCAYALLSKTQSSHQEQAVKYLMQALPNYGADVIVNDPDLDSLRDHPTFKSLLEISKNWIKP